MKADKLKQKDLPCKYKEREAFKKKQNTLNSESITVTVQRTGCKRNKINIDKESKKLMNFTSPESSDSLTARERLMTCFAKPSYINVNLDEDAIVVQKKNSLTTRNKIINKSSERESNLIRNKRNIVEKVGIKSNKRAEETSNDSKPRESSCFMSEKNPFSKSKERENSLDIKNLVKRSNISNFFEQGKKHYRELSKFSQNNDTQASVNQQNKKVHVNLYDSNKSAKYSKSSLKMNSAENKTLNAYSASKVPIKKDMCSKIDRESKAKYTNQPKTERTYCQNPELINEIAVPNRNGVNKFLKYQNYCPNNKKLEVRINNFSEANSDCESIPSTNRKGNQTISYQNKYNIK